MKKKTKNQRNMSHRSVLSKTDEDLLFLEAGLFFRTLPYLEYSIIINLEVLACPKSNNPPTINQYPFLPEIFQLLC